MGGVRKQGVFRVEILRFKWSFCSNSIKEAFPRFAGIPVHGNLFFCVKRHFQWGFAMNEAPSMQYFDPLRMVRVRVRVRARGDYRSSYLQAGGHSFLSSPCFDTPDVNKNGAFVVPFGMPSYIHFRSIWPEFSVEKVRISHDLLLESFLFHISVQFRGEIKLSKCRKPREGRFNHVTGINWLLFVLILVDISYYYFFKSDYII